MSTTIAAHLYAALPMLVLGAIMLLRRKGPASHKILVRIWVGLIAIVAVSSFCIEAITPGQGFSKIHLLAAWTLISTTMGVVSIRRSKVRAHGRWMIGTFGGLVLAGLLALDPSRIVGQLLFG